MWPIKFKFLLISEECGDSSVIFCYNLGFNTLDVTNSSLVSMRRFRSVGLLLNSAYLRFSSRLRTYVIPLVLTARLSVDRIADECVWSLTAIFIATLFILAHRTDADHLYSHHIFEDQPENDERLSLT